jgi:hypothetical protein
MLFVMLSPMFFSKARFTAIKKFKVKRALFNLGGRGTISPFLSL